MGNAANLLMFKAIPEKIFKIGNLQNLQKMYFRPTEYSETCLNRTLNKPESYIMTQCRKSFLALSCINQTPVYFEHKSCSQVGLV